MSDEARDRMELRQVVEQYARGVDTRNPELFADAFTDDALLVTNTGEVRGRERLLELPPRLARYQATMHLVGNHYVFFEADRDDRAAGQTYCVAHHAYEKDGVDRVYVMMIRYDDEYVRLDGGWRIAVRRLHLLWDEDHPLRS
jgi:uncharacterized protein (TIGR02246 family)